MKNMTKMTTLRTTIASLMLAVFLVVSSEKISKKDYTPVDKLRQMVLLLGTEEDHVRSNWNKQQRDPSYTEVVKLYSELGDEIDRQFTENLEEHLHVLDSLWIWAHVQSKLRSVDGLYMKFREMQESLIGKREPFDAKNWANFAITLLNDTNYSIPSTLETISKFIINDKLFASANKEASSQICNTQQSPQQLLYNLYSTIALTEIKGFMMMQFSWTFLKLYNLGNFTEEMELLKQQYAVRTSETIRAVKTAMTLAPRDIWKCDPANHVPEVTYTELKQLFQGYIVNEVDLNPQGTCKETCGYYDYTNVHGCFKDQFCSTQRRCNGKVLNCRYVDSDMWICPSERSSNRRYEFIQYENGMTYGRKGVCKRGTSKVDSWWRWLFWHCSYCMCYCDDHDSNSDRYFNLREVTSDIYSNKVVTGVRFLKENQIVHIQIKEGVLGERGKIDAKTVAWKKIDNYTIFDANVKSGIDYHTIMWEKRAIDLDDLDAPGDHLLTGLKFRLIGAHLNLEIRMTPFNFTTGKLVPERSLWHSHDNTENSEVYDLNGEIQLVKKRTELKLRKPDIPTRSLVQSVPDSQTNQYLLFTASDLEKDAGQTTIPFIDIQPVEPKPPAPLSGAGIYHKGRDGYGGFVSLKLITYNFESQLRADLPSEPSVIGISNDVDAI